MRDGRAELLSVDAAPLFDRPDRRCACEACDEEPTDLVVRLDDLVLCLTCWALVLARGGC